jgi:NAD+ synthase
VKGGFEILKLTPEVLELNLSDVENKIKDFIQDYLAKTSAKGVVLGLSGGVDSATAAALCSLALGGKRVLGLILPEKETYNPKDVEDAMLVAEKFGLETRMCDITPILESFYQTIPNFDPSDKICKGNIKARTRMVMVYYFANKENRLVCGSSDKSEAMLGYFTKWGDAAADFSPILDLYKTQVRKLALHLGLPKNIASKPSTPALWPNQTAEQELGLDYETLDLVLYGLERFIPPENIAKQLQKDPRLVEAVKRRVELNEHKRQMPLAIKLQYRTIGADFRLPR